MRSMGIWCTTVPLFFLGVALLWAGIQACAGPISGVFLSQSGEDWMGIKLVVLSCVTLFSGLCMVCLGLSAETRVF